MNKIRQSVIAVCVASLTLLAFSGTAFAEEGGGDDGGLDISAGPIIGYNVNAPDHGADALSVGVDARFGIDLLDDIDVVANPVVQIQPTMITDFLLFDSAFNLLGQFDLDDLAAYAGPGAAVGIDLDNTDFQFGLNVVGGVNLDLDMPIDPFVQGRATIRDGTWIMAEFGGHF